MGRKSKSSAAHHHHHDDDEDYAPHSTTVSSRASSSLGSPPPKRKRQLVSTACLCCQTKHRACGLERPCFQCVRFGIECVEGEERKKSKKETSNSRTRVKKPKIEPSSPLPHLAIGTSPMPTYDSSPQSSPSLEYDESPLPEDTVPTTPTHFSQQTPFHSDFSAPFPPPQHPITLAYVEDLFFSAGTSFTSDLFSTDLPCTESPYSYPPTSPCTVSPTATPQNSPSLLSSASYLSHTSSEETVRRLQQEVAILKQQLIAKDKSRNDTVRELQQEVAFLQQRLAGKKQPGLLKLPIDGSIDSNKNVNILLKMLKNFDDVTLRDQVAEMNVLRGKLDKSNVNCVGYMTSDEMSNGYFQVLLLPPLQQ